jgi:acyl-CoA dehydrogenase
MADFSLDLPEDVDQIRTWVHDFARDTVRPVAAEWDEREEFPWPVVEEAAKIGLYSFDFMANAMMEPSGLMLPVALEELFWGDAGIGLAIFGSALAAAGISGNGTPEQVMEWVPECYGSSDKIQLGAFCVSEPDAGSDVSSLRTRATYDQATDEWVLNGTKAWITNGGIADVHVVVATVDPDLKAKGQASFVVPPGTKGLSQGQKYAKHGIRASHTAEVVLEDVRVPGRCLLGGKDKLDAKLAKAREQLHTGDLRGHPPVGRGTGPWYRPGRLRIRPRIRQGSQGVRQADHHEPVDRLQAGRHETGDRRRQDARAPRRLDGPQR